MLDGGASDRLAAQQPMPLPTDVAAPDRWVPLATMQRAPEAGQPAAVGAPTGGADAGASGPVWQLRLPPRYRAVVREFFASPTHR